MPLSRQLVRDLKVAIAWMRLTNVPALLKKYSEEEDDQERSSSKPPVSRERRRLVEVCLIYLKRQCQLQHHCSLFCDHTRAESVRSVQKQPRKGSAPAP